jgi:hypothetical protein
MTTIPHQSARLRYWAVADIQSLDSDPWEEGQNSSETMSEKDWLLSQLGSRTNASARMTRLFDDAAAHVGDVAK